MKATTRLILAAVILVLTGILAAVALYMPEFFFSFYTDFSRHILAAISKVTGLFPFAVWEVALVLIVLLAFYFLFRNRKLLAWLAGVILLVSCIVFAFVSLWGLNHFGPSLAERLELEVRPYTREELTETVRYMGQQAGYWADQVQRDENGDMITDFSAWADLAGDGYEVLAQTNEFFADSGAPVKKLASSRLFSYMGITGIFIAYTGECNVNGETYRTSLPFTMCHELAHRLTVAAEDEANYCAFLACIENEDPAFQYSAWYMAYVYTFNALYRADRDAALELRATMSETLLQDCRKANEHYDQFEGQVQEAAQKANDTYLKVFMEESGVQSYGEVADLLIAWYLAQ